MIKAGCSGKTWNKSHEQEIDFKDPTDDLVVWRRSYPHKWDNPNTTKEWKENNLKELDDR